MTTPEQQQTVEFIHGLASTLAIASTMDGVPMMELPPRDPAAGPAARREQVRDAVRDLASECDQVLAQKTLPPTGTPAATLGRRLASRGERINTTARTYTPGPGLSALIAALLDDAATGMEN